MPKYLSMVKYTSEALKGVRTDGYSARPAAMNQLAESLGVTIESVDFMRPGGEWDFVVVMSSPSADGVMAMGSFADATGVIERSVSWELFSADQVDAAIASASPVYRPPGS